MSSEEEDADAPLQLSADTLQALAEFQNERAAQEERFQVLQAQAESHHAQSFSMDLFDEDWNASQFWYTDKTADTLAEQLLHNLKEDSAIAVISAPSVYVALKRSCSKQQIRARIVLLEYDTRFKVFGDEYHFYDFNHPLQLPFALKANFDRILCDPPFLSEDCQTRTALTVRYLATSWSKNIRLISCTGERMETLIHRLYTTLGVRTTSFEPQHSKGLSNEFRCYANFDCSAWTLEHGSG